MKQGGDHLQTDALGKKKERIIHPCTAAALARRALPAVLRLIPLPLLVAVAAGCLPGAKPPYTVRSYVLEYATPRHDRGKLNEVLRVRKFSVDQSYNTSAMLYKSEPYRITAYNYNRWRDNPGDIVTYSVLRDLRDSGLFLAVFSGRDETNSRFTVTGAVEEFVQVRMAGGWQASLSVQVTLLDERRAGQGQEVVFQKRYRSEMIMERPSPEVFAGAMSRAMAKVSEDIVRDVYGSVKERSTAREAVDGRN